MKTIFSALIATVLLAGTAQAQVYECEFNPRQTRGWAPPKLFLEFKSNTIYMWDKQVKFTGTHPKYYWNANLRSNRGHLRAKYTLEIRGDINAGKPVTSTLTVNVTGRHQERGRGKCQIYQGQ